MKKIPDSPDVHSNAWIFAGALKAIIPYCPQPDAMIQSEKIFWVLKMQDDEIVDDEIGNKHKICEDGASVEGRS